MKAQHTEGPWCINKNIGRKGELGIMADKAPCIIAIMGNAKAWPVEADANAAFIVRACNAHDELVEALQGMVGRFGGSGKCMLDYQAIDKARNAISAAAIKV